MCSRVTPPPSWCFFVCLFFDALPASAWSAPEHGGGGFCAMRLPRCPRPFVCRRRGGDTHTHAPKLAPLTVLPNTIAPHYAARIALSIPLVRPPPAPHHPQGERASSTMIRRAAQRAMMNQARFGSRVSQPCMSPASPPSPPPPPHTVPPNTLLHTVVGLNQMPATLNRSSLPMATCVTSGGLVAGVAGEEVAAAAVDCDEAVAINLASTILSLYDNTILEFCSRNDSKKIVKFSFLQLRQTPNRHNCRTNGVCLSCHTIFSRRSLLHRLSAATECH